MVLTAVESAKIAWAAYHLMELLSRHAGTTPNSRLQIVADEEIINETLVRLQLLQTALRPLADQRQAYLNSLN